VLPDQVTGHHPKADDGVRRPGQVDELRQINLAEGPRAIGPTNLDNPAGLSRP
jgi:hypothetical protein